MTRTYSTETAETKYLGYTILVRENHLTVYTPNGTLIVAGRISMQTARNVVKEHRSHGRLVAHEAAS